MIPGLLELAESNLARFDTAGASVVCVSDGEVTASFTVGHADLTTKRELTESSLFAIGSVTKSFTAAAVSRLVEAGEFKWHTPLIDLIRGFRLHDDFASLHLTVADALSHASGLPRHDLVWYGNSEWSRAEVVKRLRHLKPTAGLRQAWQYNNLMYITVGHLIEEVTGRTYEQFVSDELLVPLGMTNTNFSSGDAEADPNAARPHSEVDDVLQPIGWRGLDIAGPAGNINSCAADMAQWLLAQTGTRADVIAPDQLFNMHSVQINMPMPPQKYPEYRLIGYGLGWMCGIYRGHRTVEHGGNIDGFSANLALLPHSKSGICVLANGNGSAIPALLTRAFFDASLEMESPDWVARFAEEIEPLKAGARQAAEHRSAASLGTPHAHPREAYNGTYEHKGYGEITIGDETLRLRDLEFKLSHKHFETFEALLTVPVRQIVPVVFVTGVDGSVESMLAQLESTLEPIRFVKTAGADTPGDSDLANLVGTYGLGNVRMEISLHESTLHVQVTGQPRFPMQHVRDLIFSIPAAPGQTLEFVLGENGEVVKLVHPALVLEPVEPNQPG